MTRSGRLILAAALSVGLAAPGLVRTGAAAAGPGPAPAVTLPEPLTRDAVRELVARLSDAQVRELLLAQLDRLAAPSAPGGEMPAEMAMMEETGRLRERLRAALRAAPQLPGAVATALGRVSEGRSAGHLGLIALVVVGLILLGWGVERLYWRLVGSVHQRLLGPAGGAGKAAEASRLLVRALLDLLGLAVFAAAAVAGFLALWQGHAPTRQVVMAALVATILVRLIARVTRFLLAPEAPALRLVPLDDAAARQLARAVVRVAALVVIGRAVMTLLRGLGAPEEPVLLLGLLAGLLAIAAMVHAIWQNRTPIAEGIRGGDAGGGLRRALADAWPLLATLYVIIVFVAWLKELLTGQPGIAGRAAMASLLVVVVAPLVDRAFCWALTATPGDRTGTPAGLAGMPSYGAVLRRGVHIAVTVTSLVLFARFWGVDLLSLAERGVGLRVASALIDVAITLLLGYLLWELAKTAIDRRIAREARPGAPGDVDHEGGGAPVSRLGTLLPLMRLVLFITIVVMAAMLALSAMGVNIAPLLAGAGIFGLAVGFGAQTLVRDIVSGMFFLIDDAFRVGEYIDTGAVKGTVEKISIRSLQIRHHRGSLHTIPFGGIQRLTNESRDWMIMKFEFRLAHDTDLVKVKKLIKQIGQDLQEDPDLGPALLQPLKSQGVIATDDTALTVGAKFMARPGSQPYLIRREAYSRILKAFAANGIRFAQRQVTVVVPAVGDPAAAGPRPTAAEAARATAGGAAAEAVG